ncbi:MAG: response regulator [Pseudomonadota bacterium]
MPLRIFLVDDDATLRDYLTELLVSEAEVTLVGTAETEAEAREWLLNNSQGWDIALVDLFLAEGSGVGVVGLCRNRSPEQTLLVMTNHARDPLLFKCKLMGADEVYEKATQLEDMVAYCVGRAVQPPRALWH